MKSIIIDDVSKKFRINRNNPKNLKETILGRRKKIIEEFWAVRNISLTVDKGEFIAIIGRNGSGKSTLLKLISKIMKPTSGSILVNGHVSSLLELGAGFFPDFTGIENIYTYGTIHGRKKKEIDKKLNEIINFAEIGDFIHSPVRTYSSGMRARLAFSVAINIEPDILLVDEVLAVGDIGFKKKCINKITEIKKNGATVIMVSHSVDSIINLADKGIWIEQGQIFSEGLLCNVNDKYKKFMNQLPQQKAYKEGS